MGDSKTQCGFCSKLGSEYLCPRCKLPYCSLRCYRSELHRKCSEDFYKECVEKELKGTKVGTNGDAESGKLNFEDYMKKFEEETKATTSHSGEKMDGEEEGEQLDSDDEDDDAGNEQIKYLETVREKTIAEFETAEDDDLERRLTALGVGLESDQLFAALSEAEKREFSKLADQMHYELSGFEKSVFSKQRKN